MARDPGLRHGASQRDRQLRPRSCRLPGLRLRHGHRSHRHAEVRHSRPAQLLRLRSALAAPLRLLRAGRSRAMKFTLSWLKEHLDTDATLAQVRDALTMLGLEVESITNAAETLKGFVVGYVVEAVQHPNADRLRVCKVDTGAGVVQVVCGAPNARTGMKGIFAPTGSYIPGTDMTLKASKIRGEESNGMLCSIRELELGDDHSGIIDLPADTKTGIAAAEALGLDDPVIEIKVTPNRGDCLGVHGIARDLAASGLGTLKPIKAERVKGTFASPIKWTHGYEAKPDSPCPIVVGRTFRGVKNGSSPDWLQRRLKAIGLRPIDRK